MRLLSLLAALLMLLPFAHAQEPPIFFAHATTLAAPGNNHGIITLQQDDTLKAISVTSESGNVAIVLSGPSYFWALVHNGLRIPPPEFDPLDRPMAAGTYHAYVISSPPSPTRITLTFAGSTGENTVALVEATHAYYGNLAADALSFGTPAQILRYSGDPPFSGPAYAGYFTLEEETLFANRVREWRWATEDGVLGCVGDADSFTGVGIRTLAGGMLPADNQKPIRTTFMRSSMSVPTNLGVQGIWIQRASNDRGHEFGAVEVPGWQAMWQKELLDRDVGCVVPCVSYVQGCVLVQQSLSAEGRGLES